MTLLKVPAVQSWLGEVTADMIASKLGTQVKLGRIDLGLFNRIIIDDIAIFDQQDQEMIRTARLTARINLLDLAEGRIRISSAQLFGAHVALNRDSAQAPINIQFVIDSLSSRDTTNSKPLDLAVNSLIIRNSSVSYDQKDSPHSTGQFNVHHLKFSDISAHILLKALKEDSLNINVKRLTLREQSGVDIRRLAFKLDAGKHSARLEGFSLQTPQTQLNIDSIQASYEMPQWRNTLKYEGFIQSANIALVDFAPFVPQLSSSEDIFTVNTHFQGTATSLQVPALKISNHQQQFTLNADGRARYVDGKTDWHVNIHQWTMSNSFIRNIQQYLHDFPEQLVRIGDCAITAQIDGMADGSVNLQGNVQTEAGSLNGKLTVDAENNYSGTIENADLQFDRILNDSRFGHLCMKAQFGGSPSEITVKAEASTFEYNGYPYTGITVDGVYSDKMIGGQLQINDPNLTTLIEGKYYKDQRMNLALTGKLDVIAPQALHLSNQWGDASFSGAVDADIKATNQNDAEGNITIKHLTMRDGGKDRLHINDIQLSTGFNEGEHVVKLHGDPIDAEIQGQFDWTTLPQTFVRLISLRLPTLPGLPSYAHATNNDFDMKLHLYDSRLLQELLNIPLLLRQPLELHAKVSDAKQHLDVSGYLPSFAYNNRNFADGRISIHTPGDSMTCNIEVIQQLKNGKNIELDLNASASNNNVQTVFTWADPQHSDMFSGELNTTTSLYRNQGGVPEAHLRLLPSSLMMHGTKWEIEPCDILYTTNHLLIDHFFVKNNNRQILIDGVAGNTTGDTLSVILQDIDVAYIQDMLNFHPVDFGGDISGKATFVSTLSKPLASADLSVERFTFQNGRMGNLTLQAKLNQEHPQIDLNAIANDGPDAITYINGYVSPQRDDIDLDIQANGTHIDFLHSFTKSFLSSVEGQAHGSVRLAGSLGAMDLTGNVVVDGKATVKPLGTTYTLRDDTVELIPNHILLKRIPVYDKYDNNAILNGSINHEHLSHLTFDLNVTTDKLLSFDLPQTTSQTFYGTVMAQGRADLKGRPGETNINVDITPLSGSVFTYNIATPDAIASQEFIEWHSRTHEQNDSITKLALSTANNHVLEALSKETVNAVRTTSGNLYMNLHINTTPQAQLRLLMDSQTGDYITFRGKGELSSRYHDKGAFQMFGTYTVEEGTYDITIQNIIRKRFLFQPGGTIVFGGQPFAAGLNLQARYTVPAVSLSDLNLGQSFSSNTIRVNCLMNITGTAEQPQVDFDLEMPNVNADEQQMIRSVLASHEETRQQVVYLLGIGRFYTTGINNAETQQQDQTQLAMQSFLSGTLSTQFNQLLSQVIKTDQWNFGANISTGTEGWHNADYEGTVSGRMLDNRLLFNGQFGYRDNATQATPSFIGDFDLRYLLVPSGNLALKVYNQTNDRYFTKSSLNTQGIGLIMKKDFNGLSELFLRRRNRDADVQGNGYEQNSYPQDKSTPRK